MMFPQLSSVSLGSAERGRRAAELLLQRIADPALPPRREQVSPSLAVRASSRVAVPAPRPSTEEVP
jgi:LacI family transcriptional regulator